MLVRGGFGIGDPARNNFVPIFDDFPVPALIAVTGHDAVLNVGSHVAAPKPIGHRPVLSRAGRFLVTLL